MNQNLPFYKMRLCASSLKNTSNSLFQVEQANCNNYEENNNHLIEIQEVTLLNVLLPLKGFKIKLHVMCSLCCNFLTPV